MMYNIINSLNNDEVNCMGEIRCPECNRKMVKQFSGLKHCRCGISWKKDIGFF